MVRWRLCLALAVMILLPAVTSGKSDDDDDEDSENKEDFKPIQIPKQKYAENSRRSEEAEEEDEEDDDDEDEDVGSEKVGGGGGEVERSEQQEAMSVKRAPLIASPKNLGMLSTRTPKRRPLECYVCAYKSETPLRACLDPTKFRVHTITCHSVDDRCFTSVISKGESYEAVVRGCRSGCVGSTETTCCEMNRCNNQAFATPLPVPQKSVKAAPLTTKTNSANKCLPPSIVFFITILLILQTVGKVAFF